MAGTANLSWIDLRDQALRGDVAAAEELIKHIWQRAYRVACAVLHKPDPAQDVAQSTCLKVLPKVLPELLIFNHEGEFRRYIDVTARRAAIDAIRQQARSGDSVEADPPDTVPGPDIDVFSGEQNQQVRDCIDKLETRSKPLREIVLLRLAGYSNIAIAEILTITNELAMTNQQVGVLYSLAVKKLRHCMSTWGDAAGPDVMEVD